MQWFCVTESRCHDRQSPAEHHHGKELMTTHATLLPHTAMQLQQGARTSYSWVWFSDGLSTTLWKYFEKACSIRVWSLFLFGSYFRVGIECAGLPSSNSESGSVRCASGRCLEMMAAVSLALQIALLEQC